MDKNVVIATDKLTKRFGNFTAVNEIYFNVLEGEIFGFLGANGAGKTTAMRMLCGLSKPTSGNATIAGFDVYKQTEKIKKNIGYMSQKFSLYEDLTILENVKFFGGIYGMSRYKIKSKSDELITLLGLEKEAKKLVGSLPLGWKQKLAFSVAVFHDPKIVFLDEPTSGVDPISRRSFWELINDLSESGTTVFVTTHYLEEAEFCNNIILINAGKLIAEGNPKELKTNYLTNDILEVECSNPVKAMELLENAHYVDQTSIFGNNIHLIMNKGYKEKGQIITLLDELNDIKVNRIDKIVPTLEDVFIHLLDSKENV